MKTPFVFRLTFLLALTLASAVRGELIDGMIAYWPLDEIAGGKSPELVNGYDMKATNLTPDDVVEGKWDNAVSFEAGRQTMLERIHDPGDKLPMHQTDTFSLSMWLKVPGTGQNDLRVFSEGNDQQTTPLFNLGTHNGGADDTLDVFIRGGGTTVNHIHSTGTPLDDTWHHVVWVQDGAAVTLYFDAEVDEIDLSGVIAPTEFFSGNNTLNTTSIGGIRRGSPSHWVTGLIDDVAAWDRTLSADEVADLFANGTPAPDVTLPLSIRSFAPERPRVTGGESAILVWEASADAMLSINQGIGNVDEHTALGGGSTQIQLDATTEFTLTADRDGESVTADTTVTVIDPVSPGWYLIDDFDGWSDGLIRDVTNPYWTNPGDVGGFFIVDQDGNKTAGSYGTGSTPPDEGGTANQQLLLTRLESFEVLDGESKTGFFRCYLSEDQGGIDYHIGFTNKSMRGRGFDGDTDGNLGGVLHILRSEGEDNATIGIGPGESTYSETELEPGVWYKIWIDATNSAGDSTDTIAVHILEEGGAARTTLFETTDGDRGNVNNLFYFYAATKGGNTGDNSLLLDDIFVSKDGLLDTDPLDTDDPNLAIQTRGAFNDVTSGGGPFVKMLPIINIGKENTLNITGGEIKGDDAGLFELGAFPATLAPGESDVVEVTFTPGARTGGVLASLELASNDQSSPIVIVDLSTIVPSTNELVAHFPLDETEGDVMRDTALLRHGKYVTVGAGEVNLGEAALAGDGTAVGLVEASQSEAGYGQARINELESFGISLWIEQSPGNTVPSTLFAKGINGGTPAFALLSTGSGLTWFGEDGDESVDAVLTPPVAKHHIALSYQKGDTPATNKLEIYVDGERVLDLQNPPPAIDDPALPFLFGSYYGSLGFSGTIDDIQVYAKALIADDVTHLFTNPGEVLPENVDLDSDGDGIPDLEEIANGTNPDDPDSDDDGLNDGDESTAGTNPLVADSDGDGFSDGREVSRGTNPLDAASPGPDGPDLELVGYWPLDTIADGVSPDALGRYPLTAVNLAADAVVEGQDGMAVAFNGTDTMLEYLATAGDDIPVTGNDSYSIGFWVKTKGTGQTDLRIYAEASTLDNNPLFNIGTHNAGEDDTVDLYIRSNGGVHEHSDTAAFDDTWRHLLWVEDDNVATLYIDGVADTFGPWTTRDFAPEDLNTLSLGGIRRADPTHWFAGLVDDLAVWTRALSADEAQSLAGGTSPIDLSGGGNLDDTVFAISSVSRTANGEISLAWSAEDGVTYMVEYSETLAPGSWMVVSGDIVGNGQFTDTDAGRIAKDEGYYRISSSN